MKFSCTKENFAKGLSVVSHVAGRNANLPILDNILITAQQGVLTFTSTNLEVGIRSRIRGKVDIEGAFTVQAKLLAEYISLLPNERIDVELNDQVLQMKCAGHATAIRGMSAEEFPLIPEVKRVKEVTIQAEILKDAIQKTAFAVAMDDTRPEISGVLFSLSEKSLTLAATDSYRLAEKTIPVEKSSEALRIILPLRTLQDLLRVLGEAEMVQFYLGESQILFVIGETEIVSRLIEGQYPDYKQIIPTAYTTRVTASTDQLVTAIKTAGLFSKSGVNDIHIQIRPKERQLEIHGANAQLGEDTSTLAVEVEGKENSIVFNYRYLLEGLTSLDGEEVMLDLINPTNPGVVRPKSSDGAIYIVMPIK
jgi:DNA polymerase-3 subunit beta